MDLSKLKQKPLDDIKWKSYCIKYFGKVLCLKASKLGKKFIFGTDYKLILNT